MEIPEVEEENNIYIKSKDVYPTEWIIMAIKLFWFVNILLVLIISIFHNHKCNELLNKL